MTREEFFYQCIDVIEHWLNGNRKLSDLREVTDKLYNEVTHPHWISVEDELPKDRQPCIVLIDRKAIQGTPRIRSAVYAPNVMMQQEGFAYSHMSKKHHITHWMPLPQPPHHFADVSQKVKKGGAQ